MSPGALLLQQPLIQLRVFVGARPDIVPGIGVHRELHVATRRFDRINQFQRPRQAHHWVIGALKGPDRQPGQPQGVRGVATATERCDGGKALRMCRRSPMGSRDWRMALEIRALPV